MASPEGISAEAAFPQPGAWSRLGREARRSPATVVGGLLLLVHLVMAIFGPWLAPSPYGELHMIHTLEAPSAAFPFGTDAFGRDVFSRVLWGARGTLALAAASTILAGLLGSVIGIAAGFYRGWLDEVLMRVMDGLMSLPSLLLAMLVLTTLGSSPMNILMSIAFVFMPRTARVVRSGILSIAATDFVEAARALGAGNFRIMWHELLPNAWTPIIVETSIRFSYAILLATSLGFLGLGVQPPYPDWGLMINEAINFLAAAPWMAIFPSLAISTAVVGANLVGDRLRDVLTGATAEEVL